MDFQKILSKLSEIEPAEAVKESAPKQKVALAEDAQLRVLAGVSSILEEGRKIADRQKATESKKEEKIDEVFSDSDPVGTQKKTSSGVATKTATGMKHEKTYGKDSSGSDEEDDEPKAKKKKNESFRSKFEAMVEAKKEEEAKAKKMKKEKKMDEASKPDFLDLDKDGNKKEPMKKAAADKKKGSVKKADEALDMNLLKSAQGAMSKNKKDKESDDNVRKPYGYRGASGSENDDKDDKKKKVLAKESKMVAESVDQKLTFKQCLQLVKESGGQQQIDPIDSALWKWAQRVAEAKVTEGTARDAMAAFVYERMGGSFQLYDVLAENQK